MENFESTHPPVRRPGRLVGRRGLLVVSTLSLLVAGACSDDGEDESDGTVLVDEDFPGDSLDATCARLEGAEGDDQEAIAAALLDELITLGDEQLAISTLQMAVLDACPEWADPVDAAIAARS